MSQKERQQNRQRKLLEEHAARIEQQRKLRLRPIAALVRAIFQRPELWKN